jgi:hypothetical protein
VRETCRCARVAQQTITQKFAFARIVYAERDSLYGHLPVQQGVFGEVDDSHGAASQFAQYDISAYLPLHGGMVRDPKYQTLSASAARPPPTLKVHRAGQMFHWPEEYQNFHCLARRGVCAVPMSSARRERHGQPVAFRCLH